jgi:hypothetical protein
MAGMVYLDAEEDVGDGVGISHMSETCAGRRPIVIFGKRDSTCPRPGPGEGARLWPVDQTV